MAEFSETPPNTKNKASHPQPNETPDSIVEKLKIDPTAVAQVYKDMNGTERSLNNKEYMEVWCNIMKQNRDSVQRKPDDIVYKQASPIDLRYLEAMLIKWRKKHKDILQKDPSRSDVDIIQECLMDLKTDDERRIWMSAHKQSIVRMLNRNTTDDQAEKIISLVRMAISYHSGEMEQEELTEKYCKWSGCTEKDLGMAYGRMLHNSGWSLDEKGEAVQPTI